MSEEFDREISERLSALRQKISDSVWPLAVDAAQEFTPESVDALVLAKRRLEAIDFAIENFGPIPRGSSGRHSYG